MERFFSFCQSTIIAEMRPIDARDNAAILGTSFSHVDLTRKVLIDVPNAAMVSVA